MDLGINSLIFTTIEPILNKLNTSNDVVAYICRLHFYSRLSLDVLSKNIVLSKKGVVSLSVVVLCKFEMGSKSYLIYVTTCYCRFKSILTD